MSSPKLLSAFLPYTFANGVTIRRFAKACPKCGYMLEPANMRGLAIGGDDSLYIAAHANCPHCRRIFSVCCVVSDTKEVVKVPFPVSIMKWWIRWSLKKRANDIINNKITLLTAETEEIPPPPPVSLNEEEVQNTGEVLGYLGALPIIAYFDYQQQRYFFDRVCHTPEKLVLLPHEQLFRDMLIYADRRKSSLPPCQH